MTKKRWKLTENNNNNNFNDKSTNCNQQGIPKILIENKIKEEENVNGNLANCDPNKNEDDVETQLKEVGIIQAPDGGYGWLVVFASFLANLIVDGVIFSISETIVPLWEKEFNATTSMTTVATSLLAGCYLLSGPIGSALANSFGCNTVAILGSIIAASGLVLSVMVPALPFLYITFGIIGGIGYGLIFLPAVVIVGQYFSEKRALATGIAVCGSGIGTSLFSYLNPIILRMSNNNWKVFLLVIAGITLFCIILGYFFKPLRPSKTQIEKVTKLTEEYIGRHDVDKKFSAPGALLSQQSVNNNAVKMNTLLANETIVETTDSPHVAQGIAIERFEQPTTVEKQNFIGRSRRLLNIDRPFLSTIELHANRKFDKTVGSKENLAAVISKASMADLNRPLSKMDIFYAGSVSSLVAKDKSNLRKRALTSSGMNAFHRQTSLMDDEIKNKSAIYLSTAGLPSFDYENTNPILRWTKRILASLGSLLDFSLLKSPSFIILALSGFLTLSCFFVPFMFIGALAKQNGVDESLSKYLVVILGLVNLLGRIICGIISDSPMVDPLMVSNIATIFGGLATMVAPFCTEFYMLAIYCVPFAIGVACFAALRSIICVELLGIENLTNAYGMLMLFMGVAALIGPPFAALLKNLTNSFNYSFHVMGALMTLSGILSIPLRAINRYELKHKNGIFDDKKTLEEQEALKIEQ